MRKIITSDLFNVARIVKKYKLQDLVKGLLDNNKKVSNDEGDFGLEMALGLIGNPRTESAVYEFLQPILEVKDIKNLPINNTMEFLEKLISENDLSDFFIRVGRLFKTI